MVRTIQPEDLKEQLAARKDLILLDVRRKADYDADLQAQNGATLTRLMNGARPFPGTSK